jgi:hypothetical protein
VPEISDEEEENVIFDLGGNATMRALHLDIYEYLVYHAGLENGFVGGDVIRCTYTPSALALNLSLSWCPLTRPYT